MPSAAFFASIKVNLFKGTLTQGQVDGINVIEAAWNTYGDGDIRKFAYILATAYHETAFTLQPIAEYGKGAGHAYGQTDFTGKAPYGRGFVQLTFRVNYLTADTDLALGGKLASDYDLALQPDIAAKVIVRGMMEGWFTGRKLGDYINAVMFSFTAARAVVNGTDKAGQIALYADKFMTALEQLSTVVVKPAGVQSAVKDASAGAIAGTTVGGAIAVAARSGVSWFVIVLSVAAVLVLATAALVIIRRK
jgi:putative chitinase